MKTITQEQLLIEAMKLQDAFEEFFSLINSQVRFTDDDEIKRLQAQYGAGFQAGKNDMTPQSLPDGYSGQIYGVTVLPDTSEEWLELMEKEVATARKEGSRTALEKVKNKEIKVIGHVSDYLETIVQEVLTDMSAQIMFTKGTTTVPIDEANPAEDWSPEDLESYVQMRIKLDRAAILDEIEDAYRKDDPEVGDYELLKKIAELRTRYQINQEGNVN